jgi:hypothetical protein
MGAYGLLFGEMLTAEATLSISGVEAEESWRIAEPIRGACRPATCHSGTTRQARPIPSPPDPAGQRASPGGFVLRAHRFVHGGLATGAATARPRDIPAGGGVRALVLVD